jgi:hypothetical protein
MDATCLAGRISQALQPPKAIESFLKSDLTNGFKLSCRFACILGF